MKSNLIFIFFLLSLCHCKMAYSQDRLYKNVSSLILDIDGNNKEFKIFKYSKDESLPLDTIEINMYQDTTFIITEDSYFMPPPVEIYLYSGGGGKVRFAGDTIICYDKQIDRIYKFLIVDEYTIKSIKSTVLFAYGELLKVTFNNDKKGNSYSLSWKNGQKHGQWVYDLENDCKRVEGYNNGILLYSKVVCYK